MPHETKAGSMYSTRDWSKSSIALLTGNGWTKILLLVSILIPSGSSVLSQDEKQPPNVVMILADDHAYRDFGFMGNKAVQTPNIDRLASTSARFVNGYVPMSVCRPSLATLLTGLYPHQHGIYFNHPPPGLKSMRSMTATDYRRTRATADYLIESVPSLPRILAKQGYVCLQTGKHWEGSFQTAGFTHGMTTGRPARRLSAVTGTREQENGQWVAHGNGDIGLVIGRETMKPIEDFLDQHGNQGNPKPFLVWYAPFLPHTPFDAPKRFYELYKGKNVPDYLRPYYAEISRFDESVGQLIEMLETRKIVDNTLIVFVSDNGFRPAATNPNRQDEKSKLSVFEDGIRTPILIRLGNQTQPMDHLNLVSTVDLVPTILSAIGLKDKITSQMTGRDLMPTAYDAEPLNDSPVFGAIYPNDAQSLSQPAQHARGRWIRRGDFKLAVPGNAKNPIAGSLFNLKDDPQERTNLIDDSDHQDKIKKLTRLLDAWWPVNNDRVTKFETR